MTTTSAFHGTETEPPDSIAIEIAEAVAEHTDRTPTELPPLYEWIDAEALESLLSSAGPRATVAFDYCGYVVGVDGSGAITVHDDE